jgi:LysR family cys regulon transcriptional activator
MRSCRVRLSGPSSPLRECFASAGVRPNIALTARDSDVVKTYVRLGVGVGIIADLALDPRTDADLRRLEASHLFPINTTWVGLARGSSFRGFVYDFLSLLAAHLTRPLVEQAASCTGQLDVDALFEGLPLPCL